jgi:hypothetical protein
MVAADANANPDANDNPTATDADARANTDPGAAHNALGRPKE